MILEKINSEELEFCESWFTPEILTECLFHNFDNLAIFDETKFGNIRNYQIPMLSQESLYDFDAMQEYYSLDEKETFNLRKNVADIYCYGARLFGKTMCVERLDVPLSMLHDEGYPCGFTSMDLIHLRGVLDSIANSIKKHPILKEWLSGQIRAHPNYNIEAKNGWVLIGVNMNIKAGKDEGDQFFQRHFKKLWMEESSFETEKVIKKRTEATAEVGMIERFAGMTNFTKHMPAGEAFYNLDNRRKVLNLPQYVNKYSWSDKKRKEKIKQYGGKGSVDYLVFVEGEVIESGISEFDMDLVRENYLEKKEIKRFEIRKERFSRFRDIITIERPKNSECIYVCADVGDGAGGTDIIIMSEVNGIYRYLYNISLYSLKLEQQIEIFKYLIDNTQANMIGIECGEAFGRNLSDKLEDLYGIEHVIRYAGNKKVKVGFEKDKDGKEIIKEGKLIYKEEHMSEWSVRRLKTLLYNSKFKLPMDYRFDKMFNAVISNISGERKKFLCPSSIGDHLFDAFRVFAIVLWLTRDFKDIKPTSGNEMGCGTDF